MARPSSLALRAAVACCALAAAGCTSDRFVSSGPDVTRGTGRPQVAHAPAAIDTRVNLGGQWTLLGSGGARCMMNFGPGNGEGSIAPRGGCPGNFFMSRRWTYERTGLVIRDHTGAPLAQLAPVAASRFDGRGGAGETITLTR